MNQALLEKAAWVEIDFNRLRDNIQIIRNNIGGTTKILGIVKSNAYGHGIDEISSFIVANGVDGLGIVNLQEAVQLRMIGVKAPIVLLGIILPDQAKLVVEMNLIATVTSIAVVEALNRQGKKLAKKIKIHIRVDLGLGSIGILPSECISFVEKVATYEWIEIEGLYSHLASSYDNELTVIENDIMQFNNMIKMLHERGIDIPVIHLASSAAILKLPQTYYNMVRPGIILYGLPATLQDQDPNLKPIMQLKARVVVLKMLSAGTLVGGYGKRLLLTRETKIATVPLGYGDGLFLYYLEDGEVLIRGKRAKMIGKSFMDYFMVDVTDMEDVEVGDEVVIFGRQFEEEITIAEVSEKAKIGKMNCDGITLLSSRVPRVYINSDSKILCNAVVEG